jgi:hypothetical protein
VVHGVSTEGTKKVIALFVNSFQFGKPFFILLRTKFFFYLCGGTLGTAATTGLLYQPRMIDNGDCGEIG